MLDTLRMVLVHTKIALSEAAPCQKTNRVVKVIDEISPVCAALDLAVYPLIVQMIVRHDVLYLCRRWEDNSDAALDINKMNGHNTYKDRIRTWELQARIDLNKQK